MEKLLKGKVCLVTGASKGIGRAIAEQFAGQGAAVIANAREREGMDAFTEDLSRKYGVECLPAYFDVTDTKEARQSFIDIKKRFGRLDVLVNNAGIMEDALLGMISRKQIEDTFGVNVFAVIELMQLAEKLMSRQGGGSIINMASIVGCYGNPGQTVYSASKGAVIALTKTAAKELAPKQIRVNAIAPGMIDTDMFRSIGEERVQERLALIGMGRLGTPEDVADACVFLASDLSAYVTGQILGVDGCAMV